MPPAYLVCTDVVLRLPINYFAAGCSSLPAGRASFSPGLAKAIAIRFFIWVVVSGKRGLVCSEPDFSLQASRRARMTLACSGRGWRALDPNTLWRPRSLCGETV